MDPNTLTLYFVAGVLSAALAVVMATFAHFQPGTGLVRRWTVAVVVLAVAFVVAGIGPERLPLWTLVLGTNMALISAAVVLHGGLAARYGRQAPSFDRFGWGVVLATGPAFWYWGLVAPNGLARSAVFSFAVAILTARTTWLGIQAIRSLRRNAPAWGVTILFGTLALWMLTRGVLILMTPPPVPGAKGANPTTWLTVLGFIVVISLLAIAGMWLEARAKSGGSSDGSGPPSAGRGSFSFVEYFRNKLLLLWSAMVVVIVATGGILGIAYANFFGAEKDRLLESSDRKNQAIAGHVELVVNQADIALRAARDLLRANHPPVRIESFIRSLPLDPVSIHNIYVIDASGNIPIAPGEDSSGRNVAHRDYFRFHRDNPADRIYITPVETGQVTGLQHFRISRRIATADGRFGGVVLATISPASLAGYFRSIRVSSRAQSSLLGTGDHLLRVREADAAPGQWDKPIDDTPLWEALQRSTAGSYENIGVFDGVHRFYSYRQVPALPLVVVTGFPDGDLLDGVHDRMHWMVAVSAFVLGCAMLMAILLTIEAKRRDEQDRFMSMLSHELKTPMSVIRMGLSVASLPAGIGERMARAVTDMNAIIERCLQADRLRHGRVRPYLADCDVGALLSKVGADSTAPERVSVSATGLPTCRTDTQLLAVILGNLVDNALKYGAADGTVSIEAAGATRRGHPGVSVVVSNRLGPAGAPDPERVFGKYYRAPAAQGKSGSGLGLHVASGFAEMLGGALDYRPAADEVRFELWIPA